MRGVWDFVGSRFICSFREAHGSGRSSQPKYELQPEGLGYCSSVSVQHGSELCGALSSTLTSAKAELSSHQETPSLLGVHIWCPETSPGARQVNMDTAIHAD